MVLSGGRVSIHIGGSIALHLLKLYWDDNTLGFLHITNVTLCNTELIHNVRIVNYDW